MKSRLSVRREFLLRTLRNFKFPNFGRNYSRVHRDSRPWQFDCVRDLDLVFNVVTDF